MKDSKRWKQFLVAAVASALASVFIVAVGPGFSSPNDNAAEQAVEATTEEVVVEEEVVATEEEESTYVADPDTEPGGGDDIEENASTKADSHGHVGAGTGTSTGSQADPGHNENTEDVNDDRYQSNGPGTGDEPAEDCTNEHQGADEPQGGANENPGPYDNTCDGRISQNGQGDGANGAGTPCAGCVGNADDKNPPGQVKEFNGQKANDMGYECDGNQGVGAHYGNGNPAHTGDCGGTTTEPPTTEYEVVCRQNAAGQWETVTIVKGTRQSTDLDADSPLCKKGGGGGGDSKTIYVCRPAADGSWSVVGPISPKDKLPGDSETAAGTLPAQCGSTGGGGEGSKLIYVCRPAADGTWSVVGPISPKDKLPGDKSADSTTTPADCATSGGGNPEPKKVTICHYTGSATNPYVIIEVSENALKNGHDETHGELNPVDVSKCATVLPVDCNGDTNPNNNHTCSPTYYCPPGSPMAGQPVPGGNVNNCYITPPLVCPSNSDLPGMPIPGGNVNNCYYTPPAVCPDDSALPGMPVPGDNVNNCYYTPPAVCPAGSDMPGQPIPGGNLNNCYTDVDDTKFCPAGTDMAGQPVPPGGVKNCDDEVLGERYCPPGSDMAGQPIPAGGVEACDDDVLGGTIGGDGDKGDDVAAGGDSRSRKPLGGVLPFTGTSILAYVLVALQMIGAGALIARGRRTKK